MRLPEVEAVLNGHAVDEATIARAAEVTSATVDAQHDIHASAAYRRSLAAPWSNARCETRWPANSC